MKKNVEKAKFIPIEKGNELKGICGGYLWPFCDFIALLESIYVGEDLPLFTYKPMEN